MHLDETTRESISLKYYVRSKDAQFSWVGLRAARGSKEMWSYLVVDGSEVAEIGVLVDKKQGRTLEPIHGMDGQPIVAYFEAGTGLKTVVEVNCTDVPPNYEVRLSPRRYQKIVAYSSHNSFRIVSTMLLRLYPRHLFQTLTPRS